MLTIIGCGNPNRSDDGAGVAVAQRLAARLESKPLPGVRVVDAGTAGMDVMFQARGSQSLILIDASASGSEPGTVFEVPGHELENVPEPRMNLHDFRWDHALFAGRKIFRDQFPDDVTVFLIEKETLELGVGLSAAVDSAVSRVTERILERLGAA